MKFPDKLYVYWNEDPNDEKEDDDNFLLIESELEHCPEFYDNGQRVPVATFEKSEENIYKHSVKIEKIKPKKGK